MRRLAALLIPLVLLAGCGSSAQPSDSTKWMAATMGYHGDMHEFQELLDDVHESTGITPGPEADRDAANFMERLGVKTAIRPLLECMRTVAEREGSGEFADLATRCHEDFWIAYEE